MSERGVIRDIRFARQRAAFTGMRFGTITPTDIDGFIEFNDEVFVFMEAKHRNAELPRGQELALERLCDRVARGGAVAVCLIVHNDNPTDALTYDLPALLVSSFRYKGRWLTPKNPITALAAVEKLVSMRARRHG